MKSFVKSALLLCALAGTATSLAAQDVTPFNLNLQRVRYSGPKQCAPTRTYLIPTVQLLIEARDTSWAKSGGASAKARVFVTGFTKQELQGLAKRVYDDLVAKLRAAGNTVITYDDIRDEAAGLDRRTSNPKFGMPTESVRLLPKADFLVATPSDEQAFAAPLGGGPGLKFNGIIKAHNATLVIPEIYLTLPQLIPGKGNSSITLSEATIDSSPAMKLLAANIWRVPPNLGWCHILVAEHGVRMVSPDVGEVQQLSSEKLDFGDWGRTSGDFAFVVDNDAFDTGVLSVGAAINNLIVAN